METKELVLRCTECGAEKHYNSNGAYKNAKYFAKKNGYLLCQACVEERGKKWIEENRAKITGRPKGSKTRLDRINVNGNWGSWAHITTENRQLGIAHREGFDTYLEYQASLSGWQQYKYEVWRLTYKQPWKDLPDSDKRGRCGVEGAYQIDHIRGIKDGYTAKTPPEEIAHISNLRMLPWAENLKKH